MALAGRHDPRAEVADQVSQHLFALVSNLPVTTSSIPCLTACRRWLHAQSAAIMNPVEGHRLAQCISGLESECRIVFFLRLITDSLLLQLVIQTALAVSLPRSSNSMSQNTLAHRVS